uniref:reticulocalbin-3-like n=1 Tax=Panthera onca TaxID=9690 RepID=UPI002953DA6F
IRVPWPSPPPLAGRACITVHPRKPPKPRPGRPCRDCCDAWPHSRARIPGENLTSLPQSLTQCLSPQETLEDLDKNKDGYVQVEEYIADLYSAEPGEEEPAWVRTEREQFRDFRDLNKDGRLDGSEVGHWVLPPAQDQPLVEANHLLHESDTDKDGRLSKAEILSNWNMFVGSQATNYGEDLTRHHDEL